MRILVCGGRYYRDPQTLNETLDAIHAEQPMTELIHGAARGADSLAASWAARRGIPARAFPADWTRHGRAAGFIRNESMLDIGKPDLVVAFPGGTGTEHMIRFAEASQVPVRRITAVHSTGQGFGSAQPERM